MARLAVASSVETTHSPYVFKSYHQAVSLGMIDEPF
jgi:hypothetical protein